MFARIASLSVFALLAAATAVPRNNPPASQCNTADLNCCNSVQSADSAAVTTLAGLLGVVLGSTDGLVGLTCSPLTIIGTGGSSCTAQPVCCTGNSFNGLLVLGCSPVDVNA